MRYLISGGTGFLGSSLYKRLIKYKKNEIYVLTRDTLISSSNVTYINSIDYSEKFDVIINFAGEPLDSARWTQTQKNKILESRINSTKRIVEFINTTEDKPKLFLNSSAVGFYGHCQNKEFTEESSPEKSSFSHYLCNSIEEEAKKTSNETRLVHLRNGIVLSKQGGALAKMLAPFEMGLGGKIGDGNQWMSWIHIEDYINALEFIIEHEQISGAVNLTSPNPSRNKDFAKALSNALFKPCIFTIPSFMAKFLYGEMADELLLNGQKVLPKKLIDAGFNFKFKNLKDALNNLLNIQEK